MRLREVLIDQLFPTDTHDHVIHSLHSLDPEYLRKCLDFKIYLVNKVQTPTPTTKMCFIQTDYGDLELSLETLAPHDQDRIHRRLEWYKQQISEDIWPAVYQQTLVHTGSTLAMCLTLREITNTVQNLRADKALVELPKTFYLMEANGFDVVDPFSHLVQSDITGRYYLDSLTLGLRARGPNEAAKSFLRDLSQLPSTAQNLKQTVYLLQDDVYTWNISNDDLRKLSEVECMDWLLLGILMNLSFASKIVVNYTLVDSPTISRKCMIEELSGKVILCQYPLFPLKFRSGKCIDQYTSLTPEQLKNDFFESRKIYRVTHDNCTSVTKQANTFNQNYGFILIQEMVDKVDCVQFFIIYTKYFQLDIEMITFKEESNELLLTLSHGKYVVIRFYKSYVVKEEELTIIINKSNLVNCSIDVENSQVSDKLLILLSNIEKTLMIKKLNLARCKALTEFGLNLLFDCQYLRNITQLNLSRTAISEDILQLIKTNLPNLQKLTISNCPAITYPIDFAELTKLEKLVALNTQIDPTFGSKIRVLKLTTDFPIENLKSFSRMPLEELKLKLVENKKQQIVNFMNNLYTSSTHYTRQFIEGVAGKTLRVLDVSGSQVKYKLIKTLFTLKTVTEISLARCSNLGDEFDPVNKDVESINLEQVQMTPRNIRSLLTKVTFVKDLHVRGTLTQKQVTEMLTLVNKNINELFIGVEEYSQVLLSYINKGGSSSVNKLSIQVNEVDDKCEKMLQHLSIHPDKLINLETKQEMHLIKKIHSIIGRSDKSHLRLNHEKISTMEERIESRNKRSDWLELSDCKDITLFVHNILQRSRSKQMIKVNLKDNRWLSSPIIDILTVFASRLIQAIDMRNCLFQFDDVASKVTSWESIQAVNNGEFQIHFNENNFASMSQKYLKFFMKVHNLRELTVHVLRVDDVPFMFSILYYVVNHHKLTLQKFHLHLEEVNLEIKEEITEFWETLLTTITLTDFAFSFNNCKGFQTTHFEKLKALNYLNLQRLELRLPKQPAFSPRVQGLLSLHLHLSQQLYVTDSYLSDTIRPLDSLECIYLDVSKTNLISVEKFTSSLKHFHRLKQFQMNFEYCPIRTIHCLSVLGCLKESKMLARVSLNVSFTHEGCDSIYGQVMSLSDQINRPIMEVVALRVGIYQQQMEKELQARNITLLL